MSVTVEKIGNISFMAGAAISLLTVLITFDPTAIKISLVILGAVAGLVNVQEKDTTHFLVAAIAIIAAGNANVDSIPYVGLFVQQILVNIATFVAPAAVVAAVKAVYLLASGD